MNLLQKELNNYGPDSRPFKTIMVLNFVIFILGMIYTFHNADSLHSIPLSRPLLFIYAVHCLYKGIVQLIVLDDHIREKANKSKND